MSESDPSEWAEPAGVAAADSRPSRPDRFSVDTPGATGTGNRPWPTLAVDRCVWVTARTRERAAELLASLETLLRVRGERVRWRSEVPESLLVVEMGAVGGGEGRSDLVVTAQSVSDFPRSLVARERFRRFIEVYLREGAHGNPLRTVIPAIYRTVRDGAVLERSMPPNPDEVSGRPEIILESQAGNLVDAASRLVELLAELGWLNPSSGPTGVSSVEPGRPPDRRRGRD